MTVLETTARLRDLIAEELDHLTAIRRDLHAHPELAYEEHRTSGVVQRELGDAGVDFIANLAGGTGVLGHLPGKASEAIGLRADMDALPIVEATGKPYASTIPGKMHACGHDGHTTMLIGAARVLAKIAKESGEPLPRPVTFVFQPAEEGGAGGEKMVQDGCLTGAVIGPPVDQMYGLHCWPELELGKVSTRVGPMLAAADRFNITIKGQGGHAAYPHHTVDPILAASAVVQGVQQIASRNADPLDAVVVSMTQFHAGTAFNIIPMEVELAGTVRTLKDETRAMAKRRLHEVVDLIAKAHGATADVRYHDGYPVTNNHPEPVAIFNDVAKSALGEAKVEPLELPVMGGEDFAYYGEKRPACFFALGIAVPGADYTPIVHQPDFDFNDDAIATGVEMFCRLALRP